MDCSCHIRMNKAIQALMLSVVKIRSNNNIISLTWHFSLEHSSRHCVVLDNSVDTVLLTISWTCYEENTDGNSTHWRETARLLCPFTRPKFNDSKIHSSCTIISLPLNIFIAHLGKIIPTQVTCQYCSTNQFI